MERNKTIIIAIFVMLAITAVFVFYSTYIVKDVFVYPMDVEVISDNSQAGFNLDPDKMHFGSIPIGSVSSKRFLTVVNVWDYNVYVIMKNSGEMGKWIQMEVEDSDLTFRGEGTFILGPGEHAQITYFIVAPSGIETDQVYEGKTKIIVKRTSLFS